MGRWVPNAQGRLIEAALDLYSERGFEQTTVAEIAQRAGLTERTFFRYFADKREVLFLGSEQFERSIVEGLERAPAALTPLDAVAVALEHTATFFADRRAHARRRYAVIDANPELQERERQKLGALAAALAAALQRRGVKATSARLAAEMGVAAFKIAFENWISQPNESPFERSIRNAFEELKSLT